MDGTPEEPFFRILLFQWARRRMHGWEGFFLQPRKEFPLWSQKLCSHLLSPARTVGMQRKKLCLQMPASGFMSAQTVMYYYVHSRGIVACSAHMDQSPARQYRFMAKQMALVVLNT